MSTPMLHGLPPVIDDGARLLILGSFPSVQSLDVGRYYANPQNGFWRITGPLFGFDVAAAYESRLAALQSAGVALWDVLHSCRRVGSSDAKIDLKSAVVNDFAALFARYPGIDRVYLNGSKAAQVFRRLLDVPAPIRCHQLPSSSSARAMAVADKLAAWRVITLGT